MPKSACEYGPLAKEHQVNSYSETIHGSCGGISSASNNGSNKPINETITLSWEKYSSKRKSVSTG